MKKTSFIISGLIVLVALTSLAGFGQQQVQQNRGSQPTSSQSAAQPVDRDRYSREKARADEKQNRWQDVDSQLEGRLGSLPPCSREAAGIVAQTRDLAFESFAAHNAYYDTWLQDRQTDLTKVREVMQQRGALRRGIEADLASSKQELVSLQERKRGLELSIAAAKSRSGDETKALDALIAHETKRVNDYDRALEQWDSALGSGKSAIELLEEQKADIAQFKRLLESASGFWLAYYHAVDARAMLKAIGNCGPQAPGLPELPLTRRPPAQD